MLQFLQKYFKLFALVLFATMLTGCASIDYSRVVQKSGAVTDRVVVTLDLQKISTAGYNVNALLLNIQNDLELLYIANVREFVTQTLLSNQLTMEEKTAIAENIQSSVDITNDKTKVIATIEFKTKNAFDKYYDWLHAQQEPSDDEEENEQKQPVEIVQNVYFTTYIQTSPNAYGDIVNGNLAPIFNKYFATLALGQEFGLTDLKLTQIYASPNQDLRSNAHFTETSQGLKIHYWNISPTGGEQQLKFYTYTPNTRMWYITALTVAVAFAFVLLVYGSIRHRNPYMRKIMSTLKEINKPKN